MGCERRCSSNPHPRAVACYARVRMRETRTDAKALATGLATAIFAAELSHHVALPEHSPHAEPLRPDPARQTVADGGSLEGRPITFVNGAREPVQFANDHGEPVAFVPTGDRPT